MSHADFVHLRVHSAFSLLEGAVRIADLVKRCRTERMPAVAVTDSANLFGVMEFCATAAKAGVQPLVGCLMPVRGPTQERHPIGRPEAPAMLPLLVQSEAGYANLLSLMTTAYLGGDSDDGPAVTMEDLERHGDGLICLSGGPDGPVGRLLERGQNGPAGELLEHLGRCFPGRLYVEIMRHGLEAEDRTEEAFVDLAHRLDLPLVATNDVHFLDAEMFEAHDALLCIADGAQIDQKDRRRLTPEHRLKSAAEMADLFADLPEALANTVVIARRCAFMAPARDPILPAFATEGGRDEAEELRIRAEEGLKRRLDAMADLRDGEGEDATRPYIERLAYELDVITSMNYQGYFLIVADFIGWARSHGIPVGVRGSGAASIVAWSLDITDLDPLRFGLIFERFLNPERVSMPDFDVDFCQDRRDDVIHYVQDRYGRDRVAHIITFGTLQARAALRDVGRVMGLPYGLVDGICKLVPFNPASPPTLDQALEQEPRLEEKRQEDPRIARMIDIARRLEGLPRHASTHAAGVVIGDRPLDQLVPLYRDPRSPMPVTQFNMKDVEKAGLVKFDFLGLTTLTMLSLGEQLVRERGTPLELERVSLDDPPTYGLLARADTAGVFQLEGSGMRDWLRKLGPDCFEDIIAMVALYRPGPMDNIPRYINVKHGDEDPAYIHERLEPILEETNGVIIYQEQVQQIARELAGYSLGGADLLRRAMGKKIKSEMDAQRETFIEGAMARHIGKRHAVTIFDYVAKFASYGFNKAHAAAYALVAYRTAYLKANHPVEFFAASMTVEKGSQEKIAAYRRELDAAEIKLLPPDVNRSGVNFTVEETAEGPAIRFALSAIRGVGSQAVAVLVEERTTSGPFEDIFDLVARVGPRVLGKRLLEGLVRAGALDSLDDNRARTAAAIDSALRWGAVRAEEQASSQASLFGDAAGGDAAPKPRLPDLPDWIAFDRLQNEHEALGLYMSAHPLDAYADSLLHLGVVPAAEIERKVRSELGESSIRLAGVVVGKQERATERSRIAFVQLSDHSGQFEVTVFSELLARSRELLDSRVPLLIGADARLDGDAVKILASSIEPLDACVGDGDGPTEVILSDASAVAAINELLSYENAHGCPVRLVVPVDDGEEVAIDLPGHLLLPFTRRPDLGRIDGVAAVRSAGAPSGGREAAHAADRAAVAGLVNSAAAN